MENHSETPNVGFVGESGFIDGLRGVPESEEQWTDSDSLSG